jgi:hypothetical protein
MHNPTVLNPLFTLALAQDHQNALRAQARHDRIVAGLSGKPIAFAGARKALGTLLVRAGTRVVGRGTAPTLVHQPAL